MVTIHDTRETDFTKLGLGLINNLTKCEVHTGINKEAQLDIEFNSHEIDTRLHAEKILAVKGQGYFIRDISPKLEENKLVYSIKATHVISLVDYIACKGVEQYGTNCYEVLKYALVHQDTSERYNTQKIRLLKDSELPLGMTWCRKPIDFTHQADSLGGLIDALIKAVGKCELYYDNFGIALVDKLGHNKELTLKQGVDFSGFTYQEESSKIATRVFPLGEGNMSIAPVMQNEQEYIDSYNISKYGLREGYSKLNTPLSGTYGGPSMLYNEVIKQMSNPKIETNGEYNNEFIGFFGESDNKLDEPNLSVSLDLLPHIAKQFKIEDNKDINSLRLGDTINAISYKHKFAFNGRIVDIKYNLLDGTKTTITLQNPKFTIQSRLGSTIGTAEKLEKMLDANGNIDGVFTNLSNGLVKVNIQDFTGYDEEHVADYCSSAKLFRNGDELLFISGNMIACTNVKTGKGKWTRLASNGKFVLGDGVTGQLFTNEVEIVSRDGTLSLKDSTLDIKGINGLSAIQLGLDPLTNKAVFNVYDREGNKVMYFDDDELIVENNIYGSVYRGITRSKYKEGSSANWFEIRPNCNRFIERDEQGNEWTKHETFIYQGDVIEVVGVGWGTPLFNRYGRAFYDDQVIITKTPYEYKMEWLNPLRMGNTSISLRNNDIVFTTPEFKDGISINALGRLLQQMKGGE